MTIPPVQPRPAADGAGGALRITPTDVSQFVRFEMCERFLRFQLHSRNVAYSFMRDFKLRQQTLSPILSTSGRLFEKRLEGALQARATSSTSAQSLRDFGARAQSGDRRRKPDNDEVLQAARDLMPGQIAWLLQPRLVVLLHGWEVRGDVDVLRLSRDESGLLQVLVADMKASPHPKVDQKLQVAFYHEMLAEMLAQAHIEHAPIQCGVLYRGPLDGNSITDIEARRTLEKHKALARRLFGRLLPSEDGQAHAYFDPMDDRDAFVQSAHQMVFEADSYAARAAHKPFAQVDWHLSHKCDGCPFSEWCLHSANQDDDLSLLPHLDPDLKIALRKHGVQTVEQLAQIKSLKPNQAVQSAALSDAGIFEDEHVEPDAQAWNELEIAPKSSETVRKLAGTRGVGARLDEMILRSHALLRKRGGAFAELRAKKKLSRRGHPSLPFSSPAVNPNLVTLYIDAQYDFLQDRLYGLGTLVVTHEAGMEKDSRSIVHLLDGPPKTAELERELLERWINDTLRAVVELASPTEAGEMKAPIHLVFFDAREQRELLEALGRHFESIRQATPLYDFVTQIGSFDSSLASFLDQEMRERRNYPLTCPSLYEVASWLRFDWGPLRQTFRERLFDGGGFLELEDDTRQWRQKRARYGSSIPLEYAYAAWNILPKPEPNDEWEPFRGVTRDDWLAFAARRLEAIKHVAKDFEGNKLTTKTLIDLTDIAIGESRSAATLTDALEEFLMLERHAELGTWKAARNAPPERRALSGDSFVCRYREEDQAEETRAQMRLNPQIEARRKAWRDENPDKKRLPNGFEKPDYEMKLRLRVDCERSGIEACEMAALSGFSAGDRVIIAPRYSTDSRLPPEEQRPFQTTAKQILRDMRGSLQEIEVNCEKGEMWLHIQLGGFGREEGRGFVFADHPFAPRPNELLSVEPEISDIVGQHALATLDGLRQFQARNTLLDRLQHPHLAHVSWSQASQEAQQKFMDGLQVLARTDPSLEMEASKQEFIARQGDAPFLLVQGPPGTGKTYASSWALLARLQGAMTDGSELRILVSCKTHSAIDVLLRGMRRSLDRLKRAQSEQREVFEEYFDARLLDVPLARFNPKNEVAWAEDPSNQGLQLMLEASKAKASGLKQERADKLLLGRSWCVVGATPNACYRMCADTGVIKNGALFGHEWFGMLVVDEASQMSLPEAVMASLALDKAAPILIVGDPRQMPPIVSHDWRNETRRTFARFKAFVSLYDAVSALDQNLEIELQNDTDEPQVLADVTRESQIPGGAEVLPNVDLEEVGSFEVPRIAFEESFRLHRDMAEFLRREIYAGDGIAYHSNLSKTLSPPQVASDDPLVQAVLNPRHPLVVIVHDEEGSVLSNDFEHKLSLPILRALAGSDGHALDAREGLGVVVPHRAQRALMSSEHWNVDTVERFQGDERQAMLFCATESERGHLLRAGGFLFDPRRLNVALSRAKKKMILLASRQVFNGFFADDETFANAMLWKNLLHHTCNIELFQGELDGVKFEVWGNDPDWK